MSLPKNVVRIDPSGVPGGSLVVDVLDGPTGSSVLAYTSPDGHAHWTLPATIDASTGQAEFYVGESDVWVSAKVGTQEVAAGGGTLHHAPFAAGGDATLLRPTLDATELVALVGGSGGSVTLYRVQALIGGAGATDGGSQDQIVLCPGNNVLGPVSLLNTVSAGGSVSAVNIAVVDDAPAAGSLVCTYVELDVCNADGTEKLAYGSSSPITLIHGSQRVQSEQYDGGILEQIGTDLFLDAFGHIKSTAGGQYACSAAVVLTWTPA